MVKRSIYCCFVILVLGMFSNQVFGQRLAARAGVRPQVKRVAYSLPHHLQQYAAPAVYDESTDTKRKQIARTSCSGSCSGGSIVDGGCGGTCGDDSCTSFLANGIGASCGSCGTRSCGGGCSGCWSAGLEFTLVKPHFEDNTAFTTSDSDDATFETLTDTDFTYGNEFAPRLWIETMGAGDCGMRFTYWQFDYAAGGVVGSPPANGFGSISHPRFGDVDLSTTTPDSVFSANSDLNAYTLDLEGIKSFGAGRWGLVAGLGVRFAEVDQNYAATLRNAQGLQQGTINYGHTLQGFGPTVGLRVQRPFIAGMSLFGVARGSLLFGDGESSLTAVEDEDLANAFTTRHDMSRDDLLPIGEMQVGLLYTPIVAGVWQPYMHVAFEAQQWSGVGNAYGEDGDLGFYGVNLALGLGW